MAIFARVKLALARGLMLSIGKYNVRLNIERKKVDSPLNLDLSYARSIQRCFPDICKKIDVELNASNVSQVLAFYLAYIPLHHSPAHGAYLRTLLRRLRSGISDAELCAVIDRVMALSNLADGMPDRALVLRDDAILGQAWSAQAVELEGAYGAPLISEDWSKASRGSSLVLYFDAHRPMIRGKTVMHFAPEFELRQWFEKQRESLGLKRYYTIDGVRADVDGVFDITEIGVPDQSFDVIICHRVLEHIPDDAKAFAELFRLLRPGGIMNFSVPQAPHRATTAEWVIPDESHDGHVRHYGRDLEQRMGAAGFRVELEPWLLSQSSAALRACNAYPMRMYNAWR